MSAKDQIVPSVQDASSVAPDGVRSVCNYCSQLFHGRHDCQWGTFRTWLEKPALDSGDLKSRSCPLCKMVYRSHEQHISKTGRDSVRLDKVGYRFMSAEKDVVDGLAWYLNFELCYSDKTSIWVTFYLFPEIPVSLKLPPFLCHNTGAPESIQFFKSKFRECQDTHRLCRSRLNSQSQFLPSRLLDISGEDSGKIYLVTRDEVKSKHYFTLSHCWGNVEPPRLTAESMAALRAGVLAQSLPKTFRDAIVVTRSFSIRYLWIDCLCILQDDVEDWHAEAAAMSDVYSSSVVNIAATAAANCSIGLFFERDSESICSFRIHADFVFDYPLNLSSGGNHIRENPPKGVYIVVPSDHCLHDLEYGRLNKRAWVLQERFLSTRIMHFSSSQVFWECLENRSSETFPASIPTFARPLWMHDSVQLKRVFFGDRLDEKWRQKLYTAWQILIRNYTRCGLSKESDILVAINGIERRLSEATGDEFIAGLWKSHLVQELCWMRSHFPRERSDLFQTQRYRAPTWSWAGRNVEMHPGHLRHHENCTNLRHRVTIEVIQHDKRKSGQLKQASLQLRGKFVSAFLGPQVPKPDGHFMVDFNNPTCDKGAESSVKGMIQVFLDNHEETMAHRQHIIFLGMWECSCQPRFLREPAHKLEALVLRPLSPTMKEFERIGIFYDTLGTYSRYEMEEERSFVLF